MRWYGGRCPKIDWNEVNPLLGTIPDTEIARRYGLVTKTVQQRRSNRGIPPWSLPLGKYTFRDRTGRVRYEGYNKIIAEMVFEVVRGPEPTPACRIISYVHNEYGSAADRTIYRTLTHLVRVGQLLRYPGGKGYMRARGAR